MVNSSRYILFVFYHLVIGSCTVNEIEITTTLQCTTVASNIFSIYHLGGVIPVYTSDSISSTGMTNRTVCLQRNTNLQYELKMASDGNAWYNYTSVSLYGIYGNLVFKGFYMEPRIKVSFYTPILMGDSWSYSSSFVQDWNSVDFSSSSWQTYTGDSLIASSPRLFFRKSFTIPEDQVAYEMMLYYQYGILVYMNGEEVLRDHLPLGSITSETTYTASYPSYEGRRLIRSALDLSSSNTVCVELFLPSNLQTTRFNAFLATQTSNYPPSYNIPCHALEVMDVFPYHHIYDWLTDYYTTFYGYTCCPISLHDTVSFELSQVRFILPDTTNTPVFYFFYWLMSEDPFTDMFRYSSLFQHVSTTTDFFITDHHRKQSRYAHFCYEANGSVNILEVIPYVCSSSSTLPFLDYHMETYLLVVNETVVITPRDSVNFRACSTSTLFPAGLSVNQNGVISGIPQVPQDYGSYSVTCYNATHGNVYYFSIGIRLPYANCTYSRQIYVLAKDVPFSTTPEIVGNNVTFSILEGSLPAGVTLNSTSGVIEGTATSYQSSSNITIQMTSGEDVFTTVLSFSVIEGPSIHFTQSFVVVLIESSFSITPMVSGDSLQFHCLSTLPQGLSMNPLTGVISGTPSEGVYQEEIIVEASNESGAIQASFILSVQLLVSMCNYDDIEAIRLQMGDHSPLGCDSFMSFELLQGTLPSGLSLNTTTGHITGEPTEVLTTTVTIGISNVYGSVTRTVSITITPIPITSLSYNQTYMIFYLSRPISIQPLLVGDPSLFSVTQGTLPSGLSLDPTTGILSGSCTSLVTSIPITIQASNSISQLSVSIFISSEQPVVTFTYSDSPICLAVGISYSILPSPSISSPSFSLQTGSLPSGLSLNSSTGAISGIPQSLTSPLTVTITFDTSSVSLLIAVEDSPSFSYPHSHYSLAYLEQVSILPYTQGHFLSFSILSGFLPQTLSLDPSLGTISGTITANFNGSAVIRCSNGAGVFTTTLSFFILSPPSYFYYTSYQFHLAVNQDFIIQPVISCSDCTFTLLNSPTLPTGVSFNTSSGCFYGNPTTDGQGVNPSVSAANTAGSITTSLAIETWLPPSGLRFSTVENYYTKNSYMSIYTYYEGRGVVFTIIPSLPTGMTMDSLTGCISGTPTEAAYQQTYTVTASNPVGEATIPIRFGVVSSISNFAYPETEYSFFLDETVSIVPTVLGDFPGFSISAGTGFPTGITLDGYTGVIRGVVLSSFISTYVKITCENPVSSRSVILTFYFAAPPQSFSYPDSSYSFTVGDRVSITPTYTGASFSFAVVYGTLPSGLLLDQSSGVIEGIVNEAMGPEKIGIMIYNDKGSLSDVITIEVKGKSNTWIVVVVMLLGLSVGGYYVWMHRRGRRKLPIKKRMTVTLSPSTVELTYTSR